VAFAAGYSIICVLLPSPARLLTIVLAPAAGILAFSALTAFWVRLGLPLIWAPATWLVLAAGGALVLWRDRASWAKCTVAYGATLILFSALICTVYFLPTASNDMVQRPDGSYTWRFVDTQHFHSIAASLKYSAGPPLTPGTFTAELLYHFAPYAPAAAISKLDGLDLGDALARVTRGASLWSLVLSCFGLGTLLSLKATGRKFGSVLSVAGLFFYGSLGSLFESAQTGSGQMARAILFNIPYVHVIADGGPFDQLLVGHSMLHGLVAITVVLGLSMAEKARETPLAWREAGLLALPALVVPMHSVGSLYCLAATGILLFWGRLKSPRSWLSIILMAGLFITAWHIMGYGHAPDAAHATLKEHLFSQWWTLGVWVIIGLGFRIVGLRWISRRLKDPLSVLVLTSVVGLVAFALLFNLRDANERYGIYFLQALFSIFAFSRVASGCCHGDERFQMISEWLSLAMKASILFVGGAIALRVALSTMHSKVWIASFTHQIIPGCLLILLLIGASALMKRSRHFAAIGSTVLMGALMVGFLAWVPVWVRYGLGEVKTGITYAPGEVRGLRRLGELMSPNERFATNKHALGVEGAVVPNERSYGYSALSERPVLLEGYKDRGEDLLPWFNTLLRDNDLLFSTTDPETLHSIARTYHIQWLVARPRTDISLPRPLPTWLVEQQNCGDLKIYKIG
jgi:hypothetical protein